MTSPPGQFYLGSSQPENLLGDFQMQRKTLTLPNGAEKSRVLTLLEM